MPVHLPLVARLWLAAADPMPSELAPGEVDAVELPWGYAQALREASTPEDARASAPGPWVSERDIELLPAEGGLWLVGRWTIAAEQAGWLAGELLGPGIELRVATLDGKPAPVVALPGTTLLVAWIDAAAGREVELRVRAFVPTGLEDRLELGLLPATRGRLRATVPGRALVPIVEEGEAGEGSGHAAPARVESGVVWSGAGRMAVRLHDPRSAPPAARETLAVAHVGVGLTVGDAEVRGRARVQWELRHGALSRVRATVAGVGDDLTVEGPSVSTWSRSGDAIDVELKAPTSGRVELELRWTQAIGAGEETRLPLPRIEPDAWRSESSLQLGRDGELEVIPAELEGTAITAAALPEWGQGLVEGTPTAAYERTGGPTTGVLELLRFVPVPGPPAVIDVADYTVATTDEGRVLMKARYDLRNDRAAHLLVRPPPGLRIIGARVGLETALPSKDDQGAWRIPLRRSLETVDGLLSFPVEVIMLGEQDPWERRERRELPLPTLDAPVAAARVTLFLPPQYRSRLEPGERNVVEAFSEGEGLTYGQGVGSEDAVVADALLEEAVQGYLRNDFEGAEAKLEQIEELGVSNANVARLRSNIDVIEGKAAGQDKTDVTMERRVKEQAKARASEEFRQQEVLIAEAEKAAQAGDYAEAEAQYQAALDLGGKLAKLEQRESVEQSTRNVSVGAKLESVSKKKGRKQSKRDALDTKFKNEDSRSLPSPADRNDMEVPVPVPVLDAPEDEADAPALAGIPEPTPEPAPDPNEPEEEEPPIVDDEAIVDAIDVAPMSPPQRMSVRGRWLSRRGVKLKSAGSPRGRASGRRAAATEDSAVALYDFEDDNVDGEVLRPEGAVLSSRSAPSGPIERLPAPEVTASALSVIIPVTGQAVLYQQLLIEANQTQVIEIDARRRLRR